MLSSLYLFKTRYSPSRVVDFGNEIFSDDEKLEGLLVSNYESEFHIKTENSRFSYDRRLIKDSVSHLDFEIIHNICRADSQGIYPSIASWMENLYRQKGGVEAEFNGDCLIIDRVDLERLKVDILLEKVYQSNPEYSSVDNGLELVEDALKAIEEGNTVFCFYLY
jgi:hypothetical protein